MLKHFLNIYKIDFINSCRLIENNDLSNLYLYVVGEKISSNDDINNSILENIELLKLEREKIDTTKESNEVILLSSELTELFLNTLWVDLANYDESDNLYTSTISGLNNKNFLLNFLLSYEIEFSSDLIYSINKLDRKYISKIESCETFYIRKLKEYKDTILLVENRTYELLKNSDNKFLNLRKMSFELYTKYIDSLVELMENNKKGRIKWKYYF